MAENRIGKTQKTWLSRLLITLVLIYSVFFFFDIRWAFGTRISPFVFLHYSLRHYAPVFLSPFLFTKRNHKWHQFFSWKVWFFPSMGIIIFSLGQWKFNPTLNYDLSVLGYPRMEWQWAAVIEWIFLFITLLFLWQKKVESKPHAFCLAFYSLLLASIIYELPWYIKSGRLIYELFFPRLPISFALLNLHLYIQKWKMPKFYPLTFIFMIVCWLFYPYPKNTSWIPRLTTYPICYGLLCGLKAERALLKK